MKTLYFKPLVALLYGVFFLLGAVPLWGAVEKVNRKIEKNYPIRPDAELVIKNQFGNINISNWDKNEVGLEINISVEGKNTEALERRLDKINLVFESSSDRVSVETQIEQAKRKWFEINFSLSPKEKVKFRVDYLVKVPKTVHLNIRNKFGNIELDTTEAPAKIRCSFGQIHLGELRGGNHYISLDFSKNSSIEYMDNGKIEADYSSLDLNRVGQLKWNADFSKVEIQRAQTIDYSADYGRIAVETANRINGSSDFTTLRIGKVQEQFRMSGDFGSLHIRSLEALSENSSIETEFTKVRIGVSPKASFHFEIETEASGFESEIDLNYQKKIQESRKKYFSGTYGDQPQAQLTIETEYGSIKFVPSSNF